MKIARGKVLRELRVIRPEVHRDHRGHFLETYRKPRYRQEVGIDASFVQDNLARSETGVLRGLHFQHPHSQGKLIQVLQGAVYDVAVDVRRGSPTYGRWEGFQLTADEPRQLWVPTGFAHGYLSLAAPTDVFYKCTETYHPKTEHILRWDDSEVGVEWPLSKTNDDAPVLSEKDTKGSTLEQLRERGALPAYAK